MERLRTIQTILSLETGEQIEADDIFKDEGKREAEIFQLRSKIEAQLQTHQIEYVCIHCKQPVAIRGRSNLPDHSKHFYFTHPYKSADCIIKTHHKLTEEQVRCIKYNGEKESNFHFNLKYLIGQYLKEDKEVLAVKVDQVYREKAISQKWRKPDVMSIYKDKKIAFELQLSTTFLTVIVARTLFYRERGIFLIWIFPNFSMDRELQKFTQKDVYYNNNFNVYVFDKEARELSKARNQLMLKCYYKEFCSYGEILSEKWSHSFVTISDLKFDYESANVCYYDSETERQKAQLQIQFEVEKRYQREEESRIQLKVNKVIEYIKLFHKSDTAPAVQTEYAPIDEIISKRETQALNQRLKFDGENAYVIGTLFTSRKKPRFLKFICEQDKINVDTSVLSNGKSILQELLKNDNQEYFKQLLSLLFRKGYRVTESDTLELDKLLSENRRNGSESERAQIFKWTFSKLISKLNTKSFAMLLPGMEIPMLPIASLKYEMVIGYRFNNLRELTHSFLEYHKEFGDVYLQALFAYGQYEKQLVEDKRGKLQDKIERYSLNKPAQEKKYDGILTELFPELFN